MAKPRKSTALPSLAPPDYGTLIAGIADLLDEARRTAARAVNGLLTATYWEIGRRIVEFEQGGQVRAEYGEKLIERLAQDLMAKHGRGFSVRNVWNMKAFYLGWAILQTAPAEFQVRAIAPPPATSRGEPHPAKDRPRGCLVAKTMHDVPNPVRHDFC